MPEKQPVKVLSEDPRVEVVGKEGLRVEFGIDELLSQLMKQAPSRISFSSCNGCNGCSA